MLAPAFLEVDFDLGGMHAFGVLIELGPPGAAADGFDLGHAENELLGDQADTVQLGKRYAGIEEHVDREGALVEGRQERTRQQRCGAGGNEDASAGECHQQLLPGERALEQCAVGSLEIGDEPTLVITETLEARQHVVGHHWRQRDGDDEARQYGDDVGLAQRCKETAFDAGECKQGNEHENDNERGVEDA